MSHYLVSFLCALGFVLIAPFLGGILSGTDRFLTARMQGRQGPPVTQPFYDLGKLFGKRTVIVNRFQVALVTGNLIFVIMTGAIIYSGHDYLLSLFTLTLAEMFLCMAASSASSPYSAMASQRELLQLMCTEPMLLMTAIGFYLTTALENGEEQGSFMVRDIISMKVPAIVYMPGFFIGFLFILVVQLRKSPFDVSTSHHAHQEIVKGITTDLSGNILGITELSEWYEIMLMFTILMLFFVSKNPWSLLYAVPCALFCLFLETLVDNIFPRVKWETMFKVCWIASLICGGTNMFLLLILH